jgi:hypothetical protein
MSCAHPAWAALAYKSRNPSAFRLRCIRPHVKQRRPNRKLDARAVRSTPSRTGDRRTTGGLRTRTGRTAGPDVSHGGLNGRVSSGGATIRITVVAAAASARALAAWPRMETGAGVRCAPRGGPNQGRLTGHARWAG